MTRKQAGELILAAKQMKGPSVEEIAKAIGRHNEWTTAALLGQAQMNQDESEKAAARLGLGPEVAVAGRCGAGGPGKFLPYQKW